MYGKQEDDVAFENFSTVAKITTNRAGLKHESGPALNHDEGY
jgi:hypothetical protein